MTTLTKLLLLIYTIPGKIIPGGFNIILKLYRRFDMRFINLILSNVIGQLTTSTVEIFAYKPPNCDKITIHNKYVIIIM